MWLLVVAAGSGYLARCLQGGKRPRLFDQQRFTSPQQDLCEEALFVKDRFEKLEEHGDERCWKRSSTGDLTSFQTGIHDVQTPPCNGWASWVKKKQQGGGHTKGGSHVPDEDLATFQDEHGERTPDGNGFNPFQVSSDMEMDSSSGMVTVRTPLGDVSWRASREDVERMSLESLGDLPSVVDWTSMAATQKHLLFGPDDLSTVPSGRRSVKSRGRRSRESSVSATPMVAATSGAPVLPELPSVVRKRKAASSFFNGYHDSGYLAKEVLLFAMGMHIGVSCMLLYHKSEMEKVNKLGRQPSLCGSMIARKLIQQDDDSESTTSVVTVEAKPLDQMAVLEAELEAELEIMQLNFKDDNVESTNGVSSIASLPEESRDGNLSPAETQNWCISPRDLDRRLHILLEERQAKQIDELEAELKEVRQKLHVKEEELRSWKNRVYRLTASSLTSPTDDNMRNDTELGDTVSCDSPVVVQRPMSRKKWFSEDSEATGNGKAVHASLPSLVSGLARCRVSEDDAGDASELAGAVERLSLNSRDPVSRSCVSVSDLLQRDNRNGVRLNRHSAGEADGQIRCSRMGRRSSLGTRTSDATSQSEAQIHEEHLIYVKSSPLTSRDGTNTKLELGSEVIRTVETKCRIEERFHGSRCQDIHEGEEKWVSKKLSRPRHSTGNMFAARNRNQKQRRRWFS